MERVYRETLRRLVQRSIEELTQQVEQRLVERLLGLSEGYISKLKRGEREPSADLAAHLATLARNPKKRLRELEETWEHASTNAKRN
jgi:transcriptional regulator with XRE-family HTH domain